MAFASIARGRAEDHMTEATNFRSMEESTSADWQRVAQSVGGDSSGLADLVLGMLTGLKGSSLCMPLDPYEHSLQTATRAFKDGAEEEMVVCALLHDIGDLAAPQNHPEFAAAILRPYVSDEAHGVVLLHEIFQGYHYFAQAGLDRNLRDRYRGHPAFARAAEFCANWDQNSFDKDYESMPLAAFEPMLRRIFARQPYAANTTPRVDMMGFRINMAPGNVAEASAANSAEKQARRA
jgi:predicted HD phosphohydrolase